MEVHIKNFRGRLRQAGNTFPEITDVDNRYVVKGHIVELSMFQFQFQQLSKLT